ncbi:MAG: DUF3489 domain-containing protein [Pseudolabrys sp.]|jgi:hypothetical protein
MEIPMPKPGQKSAKKRSPKSKPSRASATKPTPLTRTQSGAGKSADATSKQAHVIAMLESPTGTTIAAMMQATGWQQHSVRGFLSGVVRKKLKLKLASIKVDGNRVYRIDGESPPQASGRQSKRRPA